MAASSWALVTGGAQRIGAFINQRLAGAGFNIVLHYRRSQNEAQALKQQLEQLGSQVVLWQADLAEPETLSPAFENLREQVGQLDLLINNASIFEQGTLLDSPLAQIRSHMDVHLTSPWLLIQEMVKYSAGQGGQIINILDANLAHRYTGKSAYFIAKKALETLTELAAIECAPKVRVNAIAPGFVLEAIDDAGGGHEEKDINLLQRKVPLDDLYSAIEFLQNNRSITGQTINIDGGSHLQCPPYMSKN